MTVPTVSLRRLALLSVLVLGLIASAAEAQTIGASVGLGPDGATVGAAIGDLRLAAVDLDVAAVVDTPSAPRLGVDLQARANVPLGLIGSVVFRGGAALHASGAWRGSLESEGSAGPLAFGVRLAGGTSARSRIAAVATPDELRTAPSEPPEGVLRGHLALSARYRASRDLLVRVEPAITVRADDGVGRVSGRVDAAAELRDALLGGDLVARLRVVSATGAPRMGPGAVDVAIGLGRSERPRRRPPWSTTLWLGAGAGVAPGASLDGRWRVDDATVDLVLAVEPWRRDLAPFRAAIRVERPDGRAANVRWQLRASASAGGAHGATGAVALSARIDLGR